MAPKSATSRSFRTVSLPWIAVRPGCGVDIDRHILPIDIRRLNIPFRFTVALREMARKFNRRRDPSRRC